MRYNFAKIEPKWQKKWEEANAFQAVDFPTRKNGTAWWNFRIRRAPACTSGILRHIPA